MRINHKLCASTHHYDATKLADSAPLEAGVTATG
jgi:hypothetical protein